jgi:hypothetical protein
MSQKKPGSQKKLPKPFSVEVTTSLSYSVAATTVPAGFVICELSTCIIHECCGTVVSPRSGGGFGAWLFVAGEQYVVAVREAAQKWVFGAVSAVSRRVRA